MCPTIVLSADLVLNFARFSKVEEEFDPRELKNFLAPSLAYDVTPGLVFGRAEHDHQEAQRARSPVAEA